MYRVYLHEFLALALVHLLAVIAPGPDFAVTVRQSVVFGRRIGVATAIGIGAGISIHVLYTLVGIGVLIHSSPVIFYVAKVVGSAYVFYLGIKFVLVKSKPVESEASSSVIDGELMSPQKAFLTGFLTNATNPKATLFFLAVFTTIVDRKTPMGVQILYGVWMCFINASWFVVVTMLFSSIRVREKFFKIGHWFERGMGVLLMGFSIKLLMAAA